MRIELHKLLCSFCRRSAYGESREAWPAADVRFFSLKRRESISIVRKVSIPVEATPAELEFHLRAVTTRDILHWDEVSSGVAVTISANLAPTPRH